MKVAGLNHVNIAAPRAVIERVRAFYIEVLGLVEGERPPLRSPGHWLYAGDAPIVHLSLRDSAAGDGAGAIDHFALTCQGLVATVERLTRLGVAHRVVEVPGRAQVQLFLRDPAGVNVELNFSGERLPDAHRASSLQ
jgi:catechol 2,3-dioxygenase-like lactoylglutathione lyase family enzyme